MFTNTPKSNREKGNYQKENVFTIRSYHKQISDEDINSLIMGLVSLVKKSTANDIHKYYKTVINNYNQRLNELSKELHNKNKLLLEVLEENQKIKNSNIDSNKLYDKIMAD